MFCGSGCWAGHGVRAAFAAVNRAVGVRLALPRWLETQGDGGDLIPDEADPRDPAPMALAPSEPEGRGPRPPMVRASPRRRWPERKSGAARPMKRGLRALGVAWKHPSLGTTRGRSNRLGPMSRSPSTVGHPAFNRTCVGSNPTRLTPDAKPSGPRHEALNLAGDKRSIAGSNPAVQGPVAQRASGAVKMPRSGSDSGRVHMQA